jgi:site-specific DNA-methyltransferase (adenine-specific)
MHRDVNGRLYRLASLINPNPDRPNLTYEFLGDARVAMDQRTHASGA